ncbi:hypothetical protein Tco_1190866 [Tanacetum coccineum]
MGNDFAEAIGVKSDGSYDKFYSQAYKDELIKVMEEVRHGSASFIVHNDVSNGIDGSMSQMQDQAIHFELNVVHDHMKQFISFVYVKNHEKDRKLLWKNLMKRNNIVNGSPWSLLGDFKVALNMEECSNSFSIKDKDM